RGLVDLQGAAVGAVFDDLDRADGGVAARGEDAIARAREGADGLVREGLVDGIVGLALLGREHDVDRRRASSAHGETLLRGRRVAVLRYRHGVPVAGLETVDPEGPVRLA